MPPYKDRINFIKICSVVFPLEPPKSARGVSYMMISWILVLWVTATLLTQEVRSDIGVDSWQVWLKIHSLVWELQLATHCANSSLFSKDFCLTWPWPLTFMKCNDTGIIAMVLCMFNINFIKIRSVVCMLELATNIFSSVFSRIRKLLESCDLDFWPLWNLKTCAFAPCSLAYIRTI